MIVFLDRLRRGARVTCLVKDKARKISSQDNYRPIASYPRHTGGAVPLRFLVKTAITAVTPPVVFHSFPPTRHTCLPQ